MLVKLVELWELLFCCVECCDIGACGAFDTFMMNVVLAIRCSTFLSRHYNGRQCGLLLATDYWYGASDRIGVFFHANMLGGRPVIERLSSVYFHLGQAALTTIVRRLLSVPELVDLMLGTAFIGRFIVICVFLMTLWQISQVVIAALRSVIRNF